MLGNERVLTRALAGVASAYAAQSERIPAQGPARQAASHLDQLSRPPQTWVWEGSMPQFCYALATACERLEDTGTALNLLEKAVEKGWRDGHWLEADPEMAALP